MGQRFLYTKGGGGGTDAAFQQESVLGDIDLP